MSSPVKSPLRSAARIDPEVSRVLRLHAFVVADAGIGGGGGKTADPEAGEGKESGEPRRRSRQDGSHGRFAVVIHLALAFLPSPSRARYRRVSRLWNAHVPLAAFPPGERPRSLQHDFEILRTVGTGTFSRVRLVRHRASRFIYAAKRLRKREQVRQHRVQQLRREVHLLGEVDHPNVARLVCVFQDAAELCMIIECVYGGELFNHLNHRTSHRASEEVARFYAAQLVLCLEHLHVKHNIVFRDLRQENILIARNGYLKLVDFGNARRLRYGERARTLCGAPESTAPEMFVPAASDGDTHHGKAVDWWALGVLCFELLVGHSPFYSENPMDIYGRILVHAQRQAERDGGGGSALQFPVDDGRERAMVSADAMAFTRALLDGNEATRLGTWAPDAGGDEAGANRRYLHDAPSHVRSHAWFGNGKVHWPRILAQAEAPPLKAFVPLVRSDEDTRNFELYDDSEVMPAQPLKKARGKMHWKRWCGDF